MVRPSEADVVWAAGWWTVVRWDDEHEGFSRGTSPASVPNRLGAIHPSTGSFRPFSASLRSAGDADLLFLV